LPVTWLAGPHHYLGAYDEALVGNLPPTFASLGKYLQYDPRNPLFNQRQMENRFQKWQQRFAQAGMPYFVGEFGTYTRLLTYEAWIRDSNALAGKYALGALWFQYRQDLFTEDQTSYTLLRRFDDDHAPYPYEVQRLKCGPKFGEVVETIFGKCFDALESGEPGR
jgi:hypothetical protein